MQPDRSRSTLESLEARRLLALDIPIPAQGTLVAPFDVVDRVGTIRDVTVNVKIAGDAQYFNTFLISPSGTRVELSTDNLGPLLKGSISLLPAPLYTDLTLRGDATNNVRDSYMTTI